MPKKTARANRPAQQRSKEEQWRKRMAAQARAGAAGAEGAAAGPTGGAAGAVRERERTGGAGESYEEAPETPAGTVKASANAPARNRAATSATTSARAQGTTATVQRRATAARASRARIGVSALSIEEEMRYIKGDIRRLFVLTTICVAIIIVLSFVVPSIIR